jgi:ADP-heptose:LPS heptosyltransferase
LKILVIRRDNIGDLVCTTPLFAALRGRYPDAYIAALVNSYNAAVLAGNPQLDAVHAYTKLKHRAAGESALGILARRLRLMARLRRERFDVVLLAKGAYDRHGLALARPLAAGRIVGFGIDPEFPAPANAELHEVEVIMQLGAALDVREPPGPLRVYPAPERAAEWRSRFPALAAGRRWIAVHISAREPGRIWPVEKFVELLRSLSRDPAVGIVLLWAPGAADDPRHPGDDERAAAIATRAGAGVSLVPARTKTLDELIAVLSLCAAFVGADGGAMHIAAGLGLPIVALFENLPYKKRHWHPWQVPYEMVCPATRDIADITPEQVIEAWRRLGGSVPWHAQASS